MPSLNATQQPYQEDRCNQRSHAKTPLRIEIPKDFSHNHQKVMELRMTLATADCMQLLEQPLLWSATAIRAHANFDITNPGSTTQYFQQQQMTIRIQQLDQTAQLLNLHHCQNFRPIDCRAVTIQHQQQLLMFCCSWLATTVGSDTLAQYQQLKQRSLGTLLFASSQSWHRSAFEYSQTKISTQQNTRAVLARRSDFVNNLQERIHLLEFFL